MDGTPNWQQPYLWYRKLGFDIPAGEKRMLRELYASVFGGPCDSSTSLQHFGRAPACAAEAEHTLLVNRIHNTKDTRWSKHGAYNDDSSGAKKARLTEDAVWRPEWGVPNWGLLLPDHWTGEVDRAAPVRRREKEVVSEILWLDSFCSADLLRSVVWGLPVRQIGEAFLSARNRPKSPIVYGPSGRKIG